jgi:hypothetical protein
VAGSMPPWRPRALPCRSVPSANGSSNSTSTASSSYTPAEAFRSMMTISEAAAVENQPAADVVFAIVTNCNPGHADAGLLATMLAQHCKGAAMLFSASCNQSCCWPLTDDGAPGGQGRGACAAQAGHAVAQLEGPARQRRRHLQKAHQSVTYLYFSIVSCLYVGSTTPISVPHQHTSNI